MGQAVNQITERRGRLTEPAALESDHILTDFDCGEQSINDWLQRKALRSEKNHSARTYVICRESSMLAVGYYALSTGTIERAVAPSNLSRNAPNPIPAILLGRLGVDKSEQGSGIGEALIADALKRALKASTIIGARAVIVHALNPNLDSFYQRLGFKVLQPDLSSFYYPIRKIHQALNPKTD